MFSASSEARDRNAPTNANQIRLQTSRIGQENAGGNLISDQGMNLHAEWDAIPKVFKSVVLDAHQRIDDVRAGELGGRDRPEAVQVFFLEPLIVDRNE
jgi:hypothetical protein